MAPMAGLTKLPFRRMVRRWGAGLVHTEMISSHGIAYDNRRTRDYLVCAEDEHPIGYQLFGAVPEILAAAAVVCVEAGADLIDLNMACPVRKVVKTGAGAALLGTPELAEACLKATVAAVEGAVPVTVKIRAGLRAGDEAGHRLAPRLVAGGAAAITIHPRTASQLYRGRADHTITLALARELEVPVIASGDIAATLPDGTVGRGLCAGLRDGGVAAVAVARAALGRPWVFRELLTGDPPPPPAERLAELKRFVAEVVDEWGERAVGHLRQFWPRFRRSDTIGKPLALELMRASSVAAITELLEIQACGGTDSGAGGGGAV